MFQSIDVLARIIPIVGPSFSNGCSPLVGIIVIGSTEADHYLYRPWWYRAGHVQG